VISGVIWPRAIAPVHKNIIDKKRYTGLYDIFPLLQHLESMSLCTDLSGEVKMTAFVG
jgi:hypothetical protein